MTITRHAWAASAACIDHPPELFFPDADDRIRIAHAKLICRRCPVRSECLEHALTNGERFGVWAGTTPEERMSLARRRGL